MSEAKSKKGVRRNASKKLAGGSAPNREMDAMCGHSHCSSRCHVRYVGAVSHVRDHHTLHASRGVANIWTAVVITGLSLVLTGAVAYTSVEAKTTRKEALTQSEFARMMNRMEQMERNMREMRELCGAKKPSTEVDKTDEVTKEAVTSSLPTAARKK
ncbi:hypothetical protein FJZ48_02675 [Candidatus Uhrbacteria bacterium]|nr:hypothetical protein [Candidatus Uhrbacteria bacterium]